MSTTTETRPYAGPIIRRGETVRYAPTFHGDVVVGKVQRVVLLRGYYDPSVVIERYLAIEGVGVLIPTSNGEVTVVADDDEPTTEVCPLHGPTCEAWT